VNPAVNPAPRGNPADRGVALTCGNSDSNPAAAGLGRGVKTAGQTPRGPAPPTEAPRGGPCGAPAGRPPAVVHSPPED